jgi:hypothetical protein
VLTFSSGLFSGCTLNLGTIDLGSSQYFVPLIPGSSMSVAGSTVSYNGTTHVLQVTIGTLNLSLGTMNTVASAALTLALPSSVVDTSGNTLASYAYTSAPGRQF